MARILNLETSATNCSVSVAENGEVLSLIEENSANYSHSEQLHKFIQAALNEAGLEQTQLDAIAVSKGPGSYTGLRIGVSAAKGLSYALDLPLISVDTLKCLATSVNVDDGFIIPLLDARRMEVYAAVFDSNYSLLRETWAEIIQPDSFEEYVGQGPVLILGNGAEKSKEVLPDLQIQYDTSKLPSAKEMAALSYEKFRSGQFEDTAYFEPFYLKDFVATKAKK